jgi:hypothetical protein
LFIVCVAHDFLNAIKKTYNLLLQPATRHSCFLHDFLQRPPAGDYSLKRFLMAHAL